MKAPSDMVRIIGRRRYSVAASTLLASDAYWDGHNFERHGRNTYLYRTAKGAYFTVNLSQWQGEADSLTPITQQEAVDLYEGALREHYENYATAFPDVSVEDA